MTLENQSSAPHHLAIIPDGNRRWARKAGFKPWLGHKIGFEKFREISEAAYSAGTRYLTFWAGSEDNLRKRDAAEVSFLIKYMTEGLLDRANIDSLIKHKASARIIGRWYDIVPDEKLKKTIQALEEETKDFSDNYLTILFGYDGKTEMLDTITRLASDNVSVTEEELKKRLWTGHLPPVDLVIRTGGEPHWSAGFMMWLTANSQLFFTDMLWPDFSTATIHTVFEEYASRERRFGK